MSSQKIVTLDYEVADLRCTNGERPQRLDQALDQKGALAETLAAHYTEFGESIEQPAAAIDMLKMMPSTPGDSQSAFVNRVLDVLLAGALIPAESELEAVA